MIDKKKVMEMLEARVEVCNDMVGVCEVSTSSDTFKNVLADTFIEGAKRAMDFLWHDASEEPKEGMIIFAYDNFKIPIVMGWMDLKEEWEKIIPESFMRDNGYTSYWEMFLKEKKKPLTAWCYFADLLPKEKGGAR